MAKDKATYDDWVNEVKSKLPNELKEHFDAIANHTAGQTVFGGYQTEKEFYRRLNDLKDQERALEQKEAEWQTWFQGEAPKNERLIAERDALKVQLDRLKEAAGLGDEDSPDPKVVMPDKFREEIDGLKQQLQFLDQALPKLLKDHGEVLDKVIKEKWDVKPGDVIDLALSKRVALTDAFNELTAPQRVEREKAELERIKTEAREEGRREALKKVSTPDNLRPNGPTIIDNLTEKGKLETDSRARVSGAVSDWLEQVNSGKVASMNF